MITKSMAGNFENMTEYQKNLVKWLVFAGYEKEESKKIAHTVVEVLKLLDGMNQRQIYLTIEEVLKVKDEITEFKFPMPY